MSRRVLRFSCPSQAGGLCRLAEETSPGEPTRRWLSLLRLLPTIPRKIAFCWSAGNFAFLSSQPLLRLNRELMPDSDVATIARPGRYRADITAGSLKVSESRVVARLLLDDVDDRRWREAIQTENALQTRNPATAIRLARLIRLRLITMSSELWRLVRDGNATVAAHAVMAAAVKHSRLLGDFLDLVVREQYRLFSPKLTKALWDDYLADCRGRDPEMPQWNESTRRRLRSSVYQCLAQAGYVSDTRSLKLQPVHIAPQVIQYLQSRDEHYVLRCLQVSP